MKRALTLLLLLTPAGAQPPIIHTNCLAENHQTVKGKKMVDDWEVTCRAWMDDGVEWKGKLPLPHPATYKEMMAAIDRFRTEGAGERMKAVRELGAIRRSE